MVEKLVDAEGCSIHGRIMKYGFRKELDGAAYEVWFQTHAELMTWIERFEPEMIVVENKK